MNFDFSAKDEHKGGNKDKTWKTPFDAWRAKRTKILSKLRVLKENVESGDVRQVEYNEGDRVLFWHPETPRWSRGIVGLVHRNKNTKAIGEYRIQKYEDVSHKPGEASSTPAPTYYSVEPHKVRSPVPDQQLFENGEDVQVWVPNEEQWVPATVVGINHHDPHSAHAFDGYFIKEKSRFGEPEPETTLAGADDVDLVAGSVPEF